MKVLYVNSVGDFGSTGNLVRQLSTIKEVNPLIVYGRKEVKNNNNSYKISNSINTLYSMASIILFNDELLINKNNTKKLIKKIEEFNPDIIHLNNIHGYYLNYVELFNYLNSKNIKIIWTLHDCWALTGYCPHFDMIGCDKYKKECNNCPYGFLYPFSIFKQNITKHYYKKKELFSSNPNLTLVVPSDWSKNKVKESYLKDLRTEVIYNGISLNEFKQLGNKNKEFTILFVANYWTKAKGLDDLEKVISEIDKNIKVIIVGQIKATSYLNKRCILINRTENKNELINLYSKSHLFINLSLEDVFGLVNVEALACGTPIIAYNTGGVVETFDKKTGVVIDKGDYKKMAETINDQYHNYIFKEEDCINKSKEFSIENMKSSYNKLYKELLNV